jgi:hypothetical protein
MYGLKRLSNKRIIAFKYLYKMYTEQTDILGHISETNFNKQLAYIYKSDDNRYHNPGSYTTLFGIKSLYLINHQYKE